MEKETITDRSEEPVIEDGHLLVQVDEVMVWSKLSRGDYNRSQGYSHIRVCPAVPWVLRLPVGDLDGIDALKEAMSRLHDVVADSAKEKVEEIEREEIGKVKALTQAALSTSKQGVSVTTSVKSTEGYIPRPSIESSVGCEPESSDEF